MREMVVVTYVFVDEVQTTVSWHEACNLLTVLDELDTNTLTNGRVRLLSLKTAVRICKYEG